MATEEPEARPNTAPVLGRPEDSPERPRRKGGIGRFLVYLVIGAIVVVLTIGWGIVLMLGRGAPDVRGQVISFDRSDPSVMVITFQVYKPADRAAVCRLRAVDVDGVEVGNREVEIPAGEQYVTRTERVLTSAQSWNGQVQHCYLVQ